MSEGAHAPRIQLRGLRKSFGSVTAVDGVDLEVGSGEFFAMLGPSGSGKTTVLRMIAGFEEPTAGAVYLDGVDVTRQPPFRFRCAIWRRYSSGGRTCSTRRPTGA